MTIPDYTFTLPVSLSEAVDFDGFAQSFLSNLGDISVNIYGHYIDGGQLGDLELDLEDVSVGIEGCVSSYEIGQAVEAAQQGGYDELAPSHPEVTLTQVREAYCETHDCNPYEYIANVANEIAEMAMSAARASMEIEYQHKARQESERETASSEADKLVVEQSIQDRNKAQELYGKQAEQMREAVKLLGQASSQLRDPSGGMSFMSEDEQLRDSTSKQIRDFLTKAVWYEADETETETETETTTDSTDAEA
jgi:hypothetical protein